MYAKIIVDIPNSLGDELFTYIVPQEYQDCIYLGSRVYVEFGFQKVLGYVLELTTETDFPGNLKEILEVIDFENGLSLEQIELAKKLANDLITPLTNTLNLMYPSFMKSKIKKSLRIINYDSVDAEVALLFDNKNNVPITKKILNNYKKIKKEIHNGNIEITTNIYTYGKRRLEKYYYLADNKYPPNTEKRMAVLNYLNNIDFATMQDIKDNVGVSDYVVSKLLESGHIKYEERIPTVENIKKKTSYKIDANIEFNIAKNKYEKISGKPYLLHTNNPRFRDDFLLTISNEMVNNKKKVLIVTPTILENTRLTHFFENSTDKLVLSFSTKLSNSEYYTNYNNLINDEGDIIITTMSGVFLPINNLGLVIVIDSEDSYYLNRQNPMYSTVEVLKFRAEYNNAKLVLTSAAPSIVDYYSYYTNKYSIISNLEKIKAENVELIDMKEEYLNNLLSTRLNQLINENLEKNKISVLILNSLYYNTTILCSDCLKLITCPDCRTGLSYHKNKNVYMCNTCNYQSSNPVCSCGSSKYKHFGYGLELLKEVLKEEFKNAKIMQVDSETMETESDYRDFILALEENDVDIIIGTYPLASFYSENIGVIGLINIDSLLNKNDYRSAEETYSLITRLVIGNNRKTIIQGYNLDHYSILDAITGNYDRFFEKELEIRKSYSYPPFNELSRLLVIGDYRDIYYFANYFKKIFRRMSQTNILGPVYLSRIKGIQLIIKYNDFDRLAKLIKEVKKKFSDKKLIVNFERYPISFN